MVRFKLQAYLLGLLQGRGRKIEAVQPHKDGSFTATRPDDKMEAEEFGQQVLKALRQARVTGAAITETGVRSDRTFARFTVAEEFEVPEAAEAKPAAEATEASEPEPVAAE